MRYPRESILAAIRHPKPDVRIAAARYFADAFDPDPAVIREVMAAVDQYGYDEAFNNYHFLDQLAQTAESLAWWLRLVREHPPSEDGYGFQDRPNVRVFLTAPLELVRPHVPELESLRPFEPYEHKEFQARFRFADLPPEQVWTETIKACDRGDIDPRSPDPWPLLRAMADVLAPHHEAFAERILAILNDKRYEDSWRGVAALRVAGTMRLTEAIPRMVEFQTDRDTADFLFEEAQTSLTRINGDLVAEAYAAKVENADARFQSAFILEHLRCDRAVSVALEMFRREEEPETRVRLLHAGVANFDSDAIAAGIEFLRTTPKDPETLDLRADVLTACKLTGERFPEFEEWDEDATRDQEYRRAWYAEKHPAITKLPELLSERLPVDDRPEPITHTGPRVGRNDPCPCGSGKKYKKCCLK